MSNEQLKEAVKCLDAVLGIATVCMFKDMDDPRRRMLYGKAGEYRLPPHGLEYRVLSNAWLCHPLITNLVLDLARNCVVASVTGVFKYWKHNEEETIRIINECDYKAAKKLLTVNKELFCKMLATVDKEELSIKVRYNMFHKGATNYIKDITDFNSNWNITTEWKGCCGSVNKKWRNANRSFIDYEKGEIIKNAKVA